MFGINKKDKKSDGIDDWFKLKFTGCGAGLNPAMGSNSAYMMTPGGGMILLECGESVFARMKDLADFKKAKWLTIIMSHTHSDHSGSLGTVVLYNHNVLNRPVNIIAANYRQKREIKHLLDSFGVPNEAYYLVRASSMAPRTKFGIKRRFLRTIPDGSVVIMMDRTKHVPEISCNKIILFRSGATSSDDQECICWSGDTCEPAEALSFLNIDGHSQIFHEVRMNKSAEHTSLDELEECLDIYSQDDVRLKWQYRKCITLMHFDGAETVKKAEQLGYQIPKLVKK